MVNWDEPIEAVHKDGCIGRAIRLNESKAYKVGNDGDEWTAYFHDSGQPKDAFCPWIIRNVAPEADPIYDKMVALVRDIASGYNDISTVSAMHEARAIVALLPPATSKDEEFVTLLFKTLGLNDKPHDPGFQDAVAMVKAYRETP